MFHLFTLAWVEQFPPLVYTTTKNEGRSHCIELGLVGSYATGRYLIPDKFLFPDLSFVSHALLIRIKSSRLRPTVLR